MYYVLYITTLPSTLKNRDKKFKEINKKLFSNSLHFKKHIKGKKMLQEKKKFQQNDCGKIRVDFSSEQRIEKI